MYYSIHYLQEAHSRSFKNKPGLMLSKNCGCFYCLKIYDTKQIINWTDEEETALCFYCGVDTVIGDSTGFPVEDPDFLKEMYSRYF